MMTTRTTSSRRLMATVGSSVVLLSALAGCAGPSASEQALAREAERYERQQTRTEAQKQQRQEEARAQIASLPDWVVEKPAPDNTGLFGVGIGESESLMLALRKANLEARFDVAKAIDTELSAEETATGSRDEQYRSIVNTFVNSVDLAGVEDIDRRIQASPTGYRVYALVKYPYPEFNKALDAFGTDNASSVAAQRAEEDMQERYDQLMARVAGTSTYEAPVSQESNAALSLTEEEIANTPDELLLEALQSRSTE